MAKKEFSATEVMALMERLEKKIDVIAEGHGGIVGELKKNTMRFDGVEEQVGANTVSITVILDNIEAIKNHLQSLNEKISTGIERKAFIGLTERVSVLENKMKAS